ncbi:MAG: ribonuclease H family protein [Chloroflexi bacterium]|nr:ribonuclease H family protein [Chloroflexota bacterium]
MAKKQKYYVVWTGRKPGIYTNWEECSAQVTGYPGQAYKSFESRDAAEKAYRGTYEDYMGQHVSNLSPQQLLEIGKPILASYSVDAACAGNPGPLEYRCVYTETGREIFKQGPFERGTNNIGEFLAIVHALALFKPQGITLPIYSDSENAISWVQEKKCKTNLQPDDRNATLFDLIARAEKWLAGNEYGNPILKWETEAWGEIPADFGRK